MYEVIAFFAVAVVGFVVGFFVGKKHRTRVLRGTQSLKDTVGKL